MKFGRLAIVAAVTGALVAGQVLAAGDVMEAIKARQALMQEMGKNISVLGKMAKGVLPYDAGQAGDAAAALAALSKKMGPELWPAGSDNFELDEKTTRAKPEIWDNPDDFARRIEALQAATATMAGAAGGGLDSLRGAMGQLAASCGGCHKPYRAPSAE